MKKIFYVTTLNFFLLPSLNLKTFVDFYSISKNEELLMKSRAPSLDYTYLYNRFNDAIEKEKAINPNWNPDYIEYAKKITILDASDLDTYYLDFNDDNGFVIIDSSNKIYKFDNKVDLYELKKLNDIAYSLSDGFLYYDNEEQCYKKIYDVKNKDIICKEESNLIESPTKHNGQDSFGDGQIYDLNAYVLQRYPDYKFVWSNYLKGYNSRYQYDNSVYIFRNECVNDQSSWTTSEGNCVINSCYSLLSNLPTIKDVNNRNCYRNSNFLNGLQTIDYSKDVLKDSQYQKYGTGNFIRTIYDNNLKSFVDIKSAKNDNQYLSSLPKLYMELRDVAISNGYLPEKGMLFSKAETMIEQVSHSYNYSFDLKYTTNTNDVVLNILDGIPSLISTSNSETYGNHAMVVYGYCKYSVEKKVWGHTETEYKYFWMVDSGWLPNDYSKFIDENGNRINWFDSNKSSSIQFGLLSKDSLEWPKC